MRRGNGLQSSPKDYQAAVAEYREYREALERQNQMQKTCGKKQSRIPSFDEWVRTVYGK